MLIRFLKIAAPIFLSMMSLKDANQKNNSHFFDFSKFFLVLATGIVLTALSLVFFIRLLDQLHIYFAELAQGVVYESAIHATFLIACLSGLYSLYAYSKTKPQFQKSESNFGVTFIQGLVSGYKGRA